MWIWGCSGIENPSVFSSILFLSFLLSFPFLVIPSLFYSTHLNILFSYIPCQLFRAFSITFFLFYFLFRLGNTSVKSAFRGRVKRMGFVCLFIHFYLWICFFFFDMLTCHLRYHHICSGAGFSRFLFNRIYNNSVFFFIQTNSLLGDQCSSCKHACSTPSISSP